MKRLLIISYWIGIIADAAATVLLFSPTIANLILKPQPFEISVVYLYVTRVAGALMVGWTVLLFWAQLKPIERADILLITLFPVVTLFGCSCGACRKIKSNIHLKPAGDLRFVFCSLLYVHTGIRMGKKTKTSLITRRRSRALGASAGFSGSARENNKRKQRDCKLLRGEIVYSIG